MIALSSVVAWLLLYLRWASRDENRAQEPARRHVPLAWVKWLSRWRCGAPKADWGVREFFLALARWAGTQNRKGDGLPGWQTIWKGWMKLRTVIEIYGHRYWAKVVPEVKPCAVVRYARLYPGSFSASAKCHGLVPWIVTARLYGTARRERT